VLARALARFPADSVRGRRDPVGALGYYTNAAAVAAALGRLGDARAILAAGEAAVPVLQAPGAMAQPTRPLLQWYATALEVAAGLPPAPRARRLLDGLRTVEAGVARAAGDAYGAGVLATFAPWPTRATWPRATRRSPRRPAG
jgi:hypothetical protein